MNITEVNHEQSKDAKDLKEKIINKETNQAKNTTNYLKSYLKHYGFFFPNAEIYQGLAKSWDCGQNGTELKKKLKDL